MSQYFFFTVTVQISLTTNLHIYQEKISRFLKICQFILSSTMFLAFSPFQYAMLISFSSPSHRPVCSLHVSCTFCELLWLDLGYVSITHYRIQPHPPSHWLFERLRRLGRLHAATRAEGVILKPERTSTWIALLYRISTEPRIRTTRSHTDRAGIECFSA